MELKKILAGYLKCLFDIGSLGAFAFILLFLPPLAGGQVYREREAFQTAAEWLQEGKYLEAVSTYQEIARYAGDPSSRARALLFVGHALNRYLDQYEEALKQFEYVRRIFPDTPAAPDALYSSGTVSYERGKYRRAYAFFQEFLDKYPRHMRRQSAEMWAQSAEAMLEKETDPPAARIPFGPKTVLRVLLKENAPSLVFTGSGRLEVFGADLSTPVYSGPGPLKLTRAFNHIAVNGKAVFEPSCLIKAEEGLISLDNHRFRGRFRVLNHTEGLSAVNEIAVEDYLYGVVPKEMNPLWNPEALKAQAVAARTYALYIREKSAGLPFDLKATTLSQVYGGFDAEHPAANQAVDATRGQVITHDGKLVIAYFHSDSGGHTEDAGNVWNAPVSYLRGIPDPFHPAQPSCAWEYTLSLEKIRQRLHQRGHVIDSVQNLSVEGRTPSGRALNMRIRTRRGDHLITANNFRLAMGAREVKSTLFQMEISGGKVRFRGRGYGHGVGLCQSGARRMAETGHGYQAILKHYYQEITLETLR